MILERQGREPDLCRASFVTGEDVSELVPVGDEASTWAGPRASAPLSVLIMRGTEVISAATESPDNTSDEDN
jgi:hypothetical protein